MSYVVEDIGTIVDQVKEKWLTMDSDEFTMDNATLTMDGGDAPYYLYGHRLDISNRLDRMGQDKVNKYRKYPLIALRMDIDEEIIGDVTRLNLNIALMKKTSKQWSTVERYQNNFKQSLIPLYELFMDTLRDSGLFMWEGEIERAPHTRIIRPYWGTVSSPPSEGSDKNVFTDPLDAIEIINLRINQHTK